MILLLVIQVLCLVIVFILNILMQQYYKAKDIEPHSSQDYELQHFWLYKAKWQSNHFMNVKHYWRRLFLLVLSSGLVQLEL